MRLEIGLHCYTSALFAIYYHFKFSSICFLLIRSCQFVSPFGVNANILRFQPHTVPIWHDRYSIDVVLELPFSEVRENITAYLDKKQKRSRLDYNGGIVTFIRNRDKTYTYVPYTDDKVWNKKVCFSSNNTEHVNLRLTTVLPDTTNFTYFKRDVFNGIQCNVWRKVETISSIRNSYELWTEEDSMDPVLYKVLGYDEALTSHYDKYYFRYSNYDFKSKFPTGIFDPIKEISCKKMESRYDSLHHVMDSESSIKKKFGSFLKSYKKVYCHQLEHNQRHFNFRHNLRYISAMNRKSLTYRLNVNHLADRSNLELRKLVEKSNTNEEQHQSSINNNDAKGSVPLPDQLDWRLYGAVTPVKDQGPCASGWSFGATGALESARFLKTGVLERLSEQELIDCSWGAGNRGCDGGDDRKAFEWILQHGGITTDSLYGRYKAKEDLCHFNATGVHAVTSLRSWVTSQGVDAVKHALASQGPVSVRMDASKKSFLFYSSGVYYDDEDCGKDSDSLNHGALVVGYGVLNDEPYWLLKNSWSTYWGDNGYALISQRDNTCGLATKATYVVV